MTEEHAPVSDEIIELAFELPANLGVDLLLRLGNLDVWRGDLAAMRDDTPPPDAAPERAPSAEALSAADKLYSGVLMRRAMEYLQPQCRDVLFLRFFERRDVPSIAKELGCNLEDVEAMVEPCRERAHEIARMLDENGSVDSRTGIDDPPSETRVPAGCLN